MRVDQLAERLGDRIEVRWHSFLLRTEPKTASLEKFIDYTRSWQRPAGLEPKAQFTTPWASGATPPSSSIPAQVAWRVAAMISAEAQTDMHHALLKAYFTENRTISDPDVLCDIAAEIGLDRAEFADALETHSKRLMAEVIDEHNAAIEAQITAVPTVVIGGVLPVPGAQDVDTYERLVERYLERRDRIEAARAASDDT